MASGSASVNELASQLYDACLEGFPPDHLFYQQDLLKLNVIPKNDVALLLQCTQRLVDQKLFRLLQGKNDRLAWKIISREDAEKYANCRAHRHDVSFPRPMRLLIVSPLASDYRASAPTKA